jgi:hypothetical protein
LPASGAQLALAQHPPNTEGTMIVFVRTAVPLPGKAMDLLAFAKEAAQVVKQANGSDVSVSISIGGDAGAVAWTSMYESLAQYEEKSAKLMADAGYHALLKKGEGLLVPGSVKDQLWRHL